eukprot:2076568-Prymnesium_polylepis.1
MSCSRGSPTTTPTRSPARASRPASTATRSLPNLRVHASQACNHAITQSHQSRQSSLVRPDGAQSLLS